MTLLEKAALIFVFGAILTLSLFFGYFIGSFFFGGFGSLAVGFLLACFGGLVYGAHCYISLGFGDLPFPVNALVRMRTKSRR